MLGRIVDIGAELFVMTTTVLRARMLIADDPAERSPEELADIFCRQARRRVEQSFGGLFANDDVATYAVAQKAMAGAYVWLEEGIITMADLEATEHGVEATEHGVEATEHGVDAAEPAVPTRELDTGVPAGDPA